MASQGPLFPGSVASVAPGDTAWVNPGGAQTPDDAQLAQFISTPFATDETSERLQATNFGFTIPGGATIDGINVYIEKRELNTGISDNSVQIIKGGTVQGNDYAEFGVPWPASETIVTYGTGTTDLWGLAWGASDINSSGFGAGIKAISDGSDPFGGIGQVDAISIKVYYTEAAADFPWAGTPLEMLRALRARVLGAKRAHQVRRAVWSPGDEPESENPQDGLVNAARRVNLRKRSQRPRVVSKPAEFEPAAEPDPQAGGLVNAARRIQLRQRIAQRLRVLFRPPAEFEPEVEADPQDGGLLNAARRVSLRQRVARRLRVVSRPAEFEPEAAPEPLATPPERFVFAMRRLELRRLVSARAASRATTMGGGIGEGLFVVEVPTTRPLGEFTKREIWAQTGLKPGEPPPWRRRR